MKILLMFVPEIWVCETCRYGGTAAKKSVRKELSHKAAGSNTFEMVRSEMSPSMRSTEETGSSGRLRKQMSPGTGRVKFIPIEAIRMSSSGAQRVEISSPRKLHSSSGRVDARETMSRRTTIEFKSAPKKSSSEKGKETYKSVPAGHVKLLGHGSEGISSTTQAQESKSCTESKELSHKAAGSNTFEMVRSEMSPSMRSRRLTEETGSSGRLRKQMSPGTGRVKFIPIEAIRTSSSGAQRVELSSPRKLHSSSGRVDARETMSRRTTIEFKSAPNKSSSEKGKETYKSVPAGHVKLFGHGSEGISSTTQAQESKSCTELKCKITQTSIARQYFYATVDKQTGGNLRADARPKNSDFQGCDLLNILLKPEIYPPTHPVLDATWCGSLEILDTVSSGQFYDGFRAHIPEKVHPKALECSRLMPNVLRCTLLPCCDCWAEIFQNYSPTVNDMALFFSPGDFERSKQQYFSLLELLETRDMALRTDINGVSLLIFSSKRLDTDSYGSDVDSFLWGAYYPAKGRLAAPPLLNYDSQANAANVEQ
ncbi:hypothetical protein C1H46_012814 [Malus baccata]|uniref:AIPP2-like SPOC-like domain-containing protein n=1 Tax=Malus baccata TaxID=106549 RepID=A0A540MS30_MALBA|nr:hypothetical protein C1H46_012814 [Malus baccata]